MSNFRNVFSEVYVATRNSTEESRRTVIDQGVAMDETKHPLLWRTLERRIGSRYTRMTGTKIAASFDWTTIKQWLIDHWPQIVSMICSIIVIFLTFALQVQDLEAEGSEVGAKATAEHLYGGPFGLTDLIDQAEGLVKQVDQLTSQVSGLAQDAQLVVGFADKLVTALQTSGAAVTLTIESPWGPIHMTTNIQLGLNQKVAAVFGDEEIAKEIERKAIKAVDAFTQQANYEHKAEGNRIRSRLFSGLHGTREQQDLAMVWLRSFVREVIDSRSFDTTRGASLGANSMKNVLCLVDGVPFYEQDFDVRAEDIRDVLTNRILGHFGPFLKV